jgi:hypothetical protein
VFDGAGDHGVDILCRADTTQVRLGGHQRDQQVAQVVVVFGYQYTKRLDGHGSRQ